MGKWSGRELLIFLKFHHQGGVDEWEVLSALGTRYSHQQWDSGGKWKSGQGVADPC